MSSPFASPLVLFDVARRAGRVGELDWVCRTAAFKAFLDGRVPPSMTLFINIEPEALAEECPPDLAHLVAKAESLLRVFVDVNDRALADDPAGVLAAVVRAREMGWGVAIDDIGTGRAPLAMLPLIDADVVKLDRRALKEASTERAAAVITSVLRHVETTGAALLVEGIESEEDARWARALGAVYGQGYHLGAPGPLESYHAPRTLVRQIRMAETSLHIDSPFQLFEDQPLPRMDEKLMDELISLIASAPRSADAWPVIIASAGRGGQLSDGMSKNLGVTHTHLLCAIFGARMPDEPAPGVRGSASVRRTRSTTSGSSSC
ncbi:EAL domain-containing protein [Pengzhenrongella sp.]|uniref:EAL domain-containing protein n=1 Tax=Pengzhenrongella sp. TaxID=2888820 RepID=UPI002F95B14F